jgi:hypothetical protein
MDAGQIALTIIGVVGFLVVLGIIFSALASIPFDHR